MFENSLLFPSQEANKTQEIRSIIQLKTWMMYAMLGLGILSTAWGTYLYFISRSSPDQNHLGSVSSLVLSSSSDTTIVVDISGAVENPGIYSLEEGDRVASVIQAAGGITDMADLSFVSGSLNLSARLQDEEKIYIPFLGEDFSQISTQPSTISPNNDSSELISINTASLSELDTLPGVGPATAQKIVDGRPYSVVAELLEKKVVGSSVYAEIQSMLQL